MRCIVLLVAIAVAAYADDIIDCPNPNEAVTLLYTGRSIIPNPSAVEAIEREIYLPETGFFRNPITCITVKDQNPIDDQGVAIEVGGGVGEYYVELNLISPRGGSIDVQIDIFSL